MMLTSQRRNAARLLQCAARKVWFDPEHLQEVKEAITKSDIRSLIDGGIIARRRTSWQSRSRARIIQRQKAKGLQRGQGSRKGKRYARLPRKTEWVQKVRAQRQLLNALKEKNRIGKKDFREVYLKVKGGFFRSRRHVRLYLAEHSMVKKQ
ncbi:50S ribosomal protein L19e [Candidatus Woesearchaeota archaeon]|nr:50S ribosomal protein L19e [Candidatus Woesearchaeota archaeon]